MADGIIAGFDGLRSLVAAVKAKIAAYVEYRRTVDVMTTMTDRELDDNGISRVDIPAVARGVDPSPQAAEPHPAAALASRLPLAAPLVQAQAADKVAHRPPNHPP